MKNLPFLLAFLFVFMGFSANSITNRKTKKLDQRKNVVLDQKRLKSTIVESQADSVAFFIWQNDAWKLNYTSRYTFEDNLQVENKSYYYQDDGVTVDIVTLSTNSYDGMNRLSQMIVQNLEGEAFVNSIRYTYSYYNDTDSTTLILTEAWDNGQWVVTSRQINRYDDKGHETSFIMAVESEGMQIITFGDSTMYEYDGDGILSETSYEYVSLGFTGSWNPTEKWDYTWTGEIATSSLVSEYVGDQWVEKEKYTDVVWDNPGGFDLMLEPSHYKIQVKKSDVWTDSLQVDNTYEGEMQTRVSQLFENNAWVNYLKEVTSFTAELMYGEYLEYIWSTNLSDWVLNEGVQIINEYEKSALEGRLLSTIIQEYDNTLEKWINMIKQEYFYDSATGVQEIDLEDWIFAYPIPAEGLLNLQFNKHLDQVEINIYNAAGSKVFNDKIGYITEGFIYRKDLQGFNKGLYFLHVRSSDKSKAMKIIVQ